MIVTLEQLTDKFDLQFETISDKEGCHSKSSIIDYQVNETAIRVLMERVPHHIPKGAVFCGGKMCTDTVTIDIFPSNDKIMETVTEFFKNKKIPTVGLGGGSQRLFNTIIINDIQIF